MADIKKRLHQIKSSKDVKTLVANFGYLSLLQVAGYLFPLITMPYLAKVIGVVGFGKIAFAGAIIIWFQTISDWGFNYTATRDVAKNRQNKEKISEIFSNVLWARVLLMIVSFLLLIILLNSIPSLYEDREVILVSFLLIPGHIMFPDWFFQAMEKMKYITILNVVSKLLFTIAVFIFIKEKTEYILQPLFVSLGFLISGIISLYFIIVRWKIKLSSPNIETIVKTIRDSTDVFISNLMPNLYNSFSTFLLGILGGTASTGLLDAGRKFASLGDNLMNILYRTFYPYLSRKSNYHTIFSQFALITAFIISFFLFVFAPMLIRTFFTEEFNDSIIILRIYSISIIFTAMYYIYGINYLVIVGKEKTIKKINIRISSFGFLISFPLIYFFDYIGASLVYLISTFLIGLAFMSYTLKLKNNNKV